MMTAVGALTLARDLIRAPSVTPPERRTEEGRAEGGCAGDGGAQDVLAAALQSLGFTVTRLPFGTTPNLFARLGTASPHLGFAGHTDVVPPGDASWTTPPFDADIRDDILYGRGACDMKGAIACFVAAVASMQPSQGSISLLVTGDEEGPATDGTVRVLEWMRERGQVPDFCLVGEPTNPERLGEVIKIGRRGSMNAHITVEGVQGHVAYPHRADNPVHRLLRILSELTKRVLDHGSEWFEPSSLQVTSIDVGNPAANVIPQRAEAQLNIRFNDLHSSDSLHAWMRQICADHAASARLDVRVGGESFVTAPGPYVAELAKAVALHTGVQPRLDTGGGTSDARFISRYCPVAEFGLVGASMHKVDECVSLSDLNALTAIYRSFITGFFASDFGGSSV